MYLSLRDRPTPMTTAATASATTRGRHVPPVVIALGVVSLLTDISSESVAAVLPLYLTTVLGLGAVAYGLLDGLYQGTGALVRIASGWVSDRSGHPKWVAFAGYGLSAAARIGFLFATGFGAIAAVIAGDRIGKGIRTAPRDAMISAAADPEHVARAFGVHRALDSIGAALGPLLAFAILWWIPDGYLTVMVVSLGCAVLGVLVLGLFVAEPRDALVSRPTDFRWRAVANPGLTRLVVVAGGLGLLTIGDGFVYLALLERGDFAATWFPLLYVGTNVAYLALALPLGRLADRTGRARLLVLGHLALVAAYLCASIGLPNTPATVGALLFLGTFYAATDGVTAALAGRLVRPAERASGIATAQTVVTLTRMVAAAGFGVLWWMLGPQNALLVVALTLTALIPIALSTVQRLDREPVAA